MLSVQVWYLPEAEGGSQPMQAERPRCRQRPNNLGVVWMPSGVMVLEPRCSNTFAVFFPPTLSLGTTSDRFTWKVEVNVW